MDGTYRWNGSDGWVGAGDVGRSSRLWIWKTPAAALAFAFYTQIEQRIESRRGLQNREKCLIQLQLFIWG